MTSQSEARPNGGDEVNPKFDPAPNSNTEKEPVTWVSGGDPMTGPRPLPANLLSEECDAPESFQTNRTKAQISKRIDALKSKRRSEKADKSR